MIINEKNLDKIAQQIEGVQVRARERKISAADVLQVVKEIERRLDIPKKCMVGIMADVDIHAQNFPNCYKGRPESTQFIIERKASGWDFRRAFRYFTRREGEKVELELPACAREAIIRKNERW